MDQFQDFCHLQSYLKYVLFIEDLFSFVDEFPQTVILAVLIDDVLPIFLVDDFFQLDDMLSSFMWGSWFKGFIDLHQYLMFSFLADGVAALFVLVDILLAPFYCPGLGLDLICLWEDEGLASTDLPESSFAH